MRNYLYIFALLAKSIRPSGALIWLAIFRYYLQTRLRRHWDGLIHCDGWSICLLWLYQTIRVPFYTIPLRFMRCLLHKTQHVFVYSAGCAKLTRRNEFMAFKLRRSLVDAYRSLTHNLVLCWVNINRHVVMAYYIKPL